MTDKILILDFGMLITDRPVDRRIVLRYPEATVRGTANG